jgi:hypothetical protein
MSISRTGGLSGFAKEWGPLVMMVLSLATFCVGYVRTESSREADRQIVVQNQQQIAAEMKEIKEDIKTFSGYASDIRALNVKTSESSERIKVLETLQLERATAVATLRTVSEMQNKLLDNLTADVRKLQERSKIASSSN